MVPWGQLSTAGPWVRRGWQHHKRTWWAQVTSSRVEAWSCAVWGLSVRRTRMPWGGRGSESDTIGHPFPRQTALNLFPSVFTQGPWDMFSPAPFFLLGSRPISELYFLSLYFLPHFKQASLLISQMQVPRSACNCSSKPAFWRRGYSTWVCGFPCSQVEKAIEPTSYVPGEFSNL